MHVLLQHSERSLLLARPLGVHQQRKRKQEEPAVRRAGFQIHCATANDVFALEDWVEIYRAGSWHSSNRYVSGEGGGILDMGCERRP